MNKILVELGIIRYVGWIMSPMYNGNSFEQWRIDKRENGSNRVLAMTDINLRDGTILTLPDLQVAYWWQYSWSKQSPWDRAVCNRKTLKQLIQILIPEVEFHRPPKVTESDRLSIKKTHDAAIHEVEAKGILAIQNKWNYCLKLHSCYERQSIAAVRVFCKFRGAFVSTRW